MEYTTVLSLVNIGLIVTYTLLGIALLGAVWATVKGLLANPKGAKMALLGLVGVAVIIFLAYLFSSGSDISEIVLDKTNTAQWWVRPVGTGLLTFYILFIGVVGLILTTEVLRPFKK